MTERPEDLKLMMDEATFLALAVADIYPILDSEIAWLAAETEATPRDKGLLS